MLRFITISVCITAFTLISLLSFAGTITVGLGPEYLYNTIQEGINAALTGDTVLVYPGIYTGAGNHDINFGGKDVNLTSVAGRDSTIIDVGNGYRGFYFSSGETSAAVIDGFTVRNAYMTSDGAGIYCTGSSPTISNCRFENNISYYDCKGGGIYLSNGSSSVIQNCDFDGNAARHGGGICARNDSDVQVLSCTFENNHAYYAGAGIWTHTSDPYVSFCTFTGNTGDSGAGGVRSDNGTLTLENSIFTANIANVGSAVCVDTTTLRMIHCTITGNLLSSGDGHAVFAMEYSSLDMLNTIVWDNAGGAILVEPRSYGAEVGYSDIEGGWLGDGNIDVDPMFVDALNGNYQILWNSPCVDAGTDAGVYVDFDGNVRPYDMPGIDNNGPLADFDMGAYEAIPEPSIMMLSGAMLLAGLAGKRLRRK